MTIISLHITNTSLMAVADSLISNNHPARVLAEDKKIVIFEPRYRIPRVSLGRFNYFSDFTAGNFGIAYAGTLSLVSTTLNAFQDVVRNCMFLDRDSTEKGKPRVYWQRNFEGRFKDCSYDDSYNFGSEELPPITVSMLAFILISVCQKTCLDFRKNAMKQPDLQFLLFGEEMVGYQRRVRCDVVKILGFEGDELRYEHSSVLPNHVAMIGDKMVIDELTRVIRKDTKFSAPPNEQQVSGGRATSPDLDGYEVDIKEQRTEAWANRRRQVLKKCTLEFIDKETNTVGGDVSVAEIGWTRPLRLSIIRKEHIEEEIQRLSKALSS
ncbi:hypothetical protein [Variovorax soli]|uniref:hypothetical protein n=1 Tax=Variovorax soli TaxID=376815 RepID=UPI000AF6FAFF|nr:hypothetical protein [Variovorax soli]